MQDSEVLTGTTHVNKTTIRTTHPPRRRHFVKCKFNVSQRLKTRVSKETLPLENVRIVTEVNNLHNPPVLTTDTLYPYIYMLHLYKTNCALLFPELYLTQPNVNVSFKMTLFDFTVITNNSIVTEKGRKD